MLTPFDSIKKIYSDVISQQNKDYKEDFKLAQEFIIWIVGFSVGGLYLLFSNLDKAQSDFGHCFLKLFITLLTVSISFGAIYRLSVTKYREYLRRSLSYLEGAFSSENVMSIKDYDISSETDIKVVFDKIKSDFGEDMSKLIANYNDLDTPTQAKVLESLKDHYKNLAQWAKKDYNFALNYVKTTFQRAFGMSDKAFNKAINQDYIWSLKFWRIISGISFVICCLSFVIVPILICIVF